MISMILRAIVTVSSRARERCSELAIIDAALVHRGVEVPVDSLREQAGRVLKLRVPWCPPAIESVPIPHHSDVQLGTPLGSSRTNDEMCLRSPSVGFR
ncbi:MAG: hypothetical protein R3F65_08360 [bacterium]